MKKLRMLALLLAFALFLLGGGIVAQATGMTTDEKVVGETVTNDGEDFIVDEISDLEDVNATEGTLDTSDAQEVDLSGIEFVNDEQ
ncbi:trypsin-like peptidase domain-containing protein, partial [Listeria ivanovii]